MRAKQQDSISDKFKSCNTCRIVWQQISQLTRNYYAEPYDYYKDFPHYGLEKQICPRCEEVPNVSTC